MNNTLRLGTMPNSTNGLKRVAQPTFVASGVRTVAIMPSGGMSMINNSLGLTSARNIIAPQGGAGSKFVANHNSVAKFGTQAISMLTSNVTVSPQKMDVGLQSSLQVCPSTNSSTVWKAPLVSSNSRPPQIATPLSPSKVFIQINSNQLVRIS